MTDELQHTVSLGNGFTNLKLLDAVFVVIQEKLLIWIFSLNHPFGG